MIHELFLKGQYSQWIGHSLMKLLSRNCILFFLSLAMDSHSTSAQHFFVLHNPCANKCSSSIRNFQLSSWHSWISTDDTNVTYGRFILKDSIQDSIYPETCANYARRDESSAACTIGAFAWSDLCLHLFTFHNHFMYRPMKAGQPALVFHVLSHIA